MFQIKSYGTKNRNYCYNYIYNAIQSLFPYWSTVESFQEWHRIYFVRFTDGRCTFVSKKRINAIALRVMAKQRRAKSADIIIIESSVGEYFAKSTTEGHYKLVPTMELIDCGCMDHQIMSGTFHTNQVVCKHGYALLNYLGYSTLRDCVKGNHEKLAYELEMADHLEYRQYLQG